MKAIVGRFVKNGSIVAAGQIISFLLIPFLSRTYSPEQFTEFALVLSAFTILTTVVTLKLSDAILVIKSRRNITSLIQLNIFFAFIFCSISYLICSNQTTFEWLAYNALLINLSVLSFSIGTGFHNLFARRGQLMAYSFFSAALPITTAILQLALGRIFKNEHGLEIGFLAGNTIWALSLLIASIKEGNFSYLQIYPSLPFYWTRIKAHKNYPLYSVPYNLTGALRIRGIHLLLGQNIVTGQYQMLDRVLTAPSNLMGSVLRPIMIDHIHKKGITKIQRDVWLLCLSFAMLGLPFINWTWVHSDLFISVAFGTQWSKAAALWLPMSINALMMMLTNWMDRFFDFFNEQRKRSLLELIYSFLSLFSSYVALRAWPENATYAVYAYVAFSCLYYMHWLAFLGKKMGDKNLALRLLIVMVCLSAATTSLYKSVDLWGTPMTSFILAGALTLLVALFILRASKKGYLADGLND